MLEGRIEHGDSLGNSGVIGPGDVQWMTAGSGIIHSEMPAQHDGKLWGFQLWVNLPAAQKMRDPSYRDLTRDEIPVVRNKDGTDVKLIAGSVAGFTGPLGGLDVEPVYLEVFMSPQRSFEQLVSPTHNVFAYVFGGSVEIGPENTLVEAPGLVVFGDGGPVEFETKDSQSRFLLVAGKPLDEPVARGGPFVMNTREEIEQAYAEYQRGDFVKKSA